MIAGDGRNEVSEGRINFVGKLYSELYLQLLLWSGVWDESN